MNVLIVDDSRAMRKIIRGIFEMRGHSVIEASDGKAAAEQLEQGIPFDLAMVDWNMPVMNGLEFVKHVRADPKFTSMKLVMVTTESEPAKMARAFMSGLDEYVMKPFTPEILTEKLNLIGLKA